MTAPPTAGDPEALYRANCSRCHLPDGAGVAGMAPALEDSEAVKADDPGELIRVVLWGQGGKAIRGQHYPSRMPGFSELLKDDEIAAVVNHTRKKWGSNARQVTAADVQRERQKP